MDILFLEDMRDFIRYTLVAKDPDGHLELDEWNGKRNSAWHLHHKYFIDEEQIVVIDDEFLSDEAKENIDSYGGEGTYDNLNFDPNSHERMQLNWTATETKALVNETLVDYNKMMVNYTKGTDGGDGNPIVSSIWQDRGMLACVN